MATRRKKIAVIGGGIIGLSSAVRIVETTPDVQVTIIAEKLSPHTTGDGSAGYWFPYLIGEVSPAEIKFWCENTFSFLKDIYFSPEATDYGVGLLSSYQLFEEPREKPTYSDVFLEWRDVKPSEISLFPSRYKYGFFLTTLFAECTKLLPMLMKRFKNRGGKVDQRRLKTISEVHAPWIKHAVAGGDDFYILPNSEEVICGGTHQVGDWNTNVDSNDSKRIWAGCTELLPSLKKAKILREWVGLRPGRPTPRLERESMKTKNGVLEVIHNYGHGGSGVTLFWGCAIRVAELLQDVLTEMTNVPSKL